ncbi:uncharacterized protein CMC5_022910 [Chondromyces crocatus]|uniref:Protein kinase domain-containing protein n=2 Tax=Chondromyces crocatus TaxID=52 RepID=A0A0K1EC59_CHOCO|nr:uncharacterized protein CMC5_022910 [Chondromyces crocatus]
MRLRMQTGELVAGRFEIVRHAGSGGMGAVYKARDRETSQPVAVKVLHGHSAAHAERFAREAQLLSELRHPGIVRFVGSGVTAQGDGFIVMEWLEGESLSARLKRGPLSVAEAIQLGVRVADALRPAHERGIVHRDLKPPNLFLEGGTIEKLKVLDFGIARILEPGQKLTITGQMIGTPGYMSPEQARGDQSVDARTDVYALGCVLYRALTGRRVFEGEDPVSALIKVTVEEPPRAAVYRPEVPPALDDLVARMLAISPLRRPRDATAVLSELLVIGGFQDGETAIAPSTGPRAVGPAGSFASMQPSSFSPAPPPGGGTASAARAASPVQPASPIAAQPTGHPPHASVSVVGPPSVVPTPTMASAYAQPSASGYGPAYGPPHGPPHGPPLTGHGSSHGAGYFTGHPYPGAPYGAAPPQTPPQTNKAMVFGLVGAVGALLVVLFGGVLLLLIAPASSPGSSFGGSSAVCPGERCLAFEVPDPSRADAVKLLPAVRKVAREIEPTAELVLLSLVNGSREGLIDTKDQRQIVQYHFQNAQRDSRFYLWLGDGRLVMSRSTAVPTQLPLADPSCSMPAIIRAAGLSEGYSTATLLDSAGGFGPTFMIAGAQGNAFIDPRACTPKKMF